MLRPLFASEPTFGGSRQREHAMSTIYASFDEPSSARAALQELVHGGLANDGLSLVVRDAPEGRVSELSQEARSVGDATALVGRDDDPETPEYPGNPESIEADLTALEGSSIGGIDTSRKEFDVDSVDQSDDSQEEADRMTYPRHGISASEHERDDLNLTVLTGFPTTVPILDPLPDDWSEGEAQATDGLDTLHLPGFGTVIGGGGLATAALSLTNSGNSREAVHRFLTDEGVPAGRANELTAGLLSGRAIIAVEVVPGDVREDSVEEVLQRHGGRDVELYDAPRFYANGGRMPKSGGGES